VRADDLISGNPARDEGTNLKRHSRTLGHAGGTYPESGRIDSRFHTRCSAARSRSNTPGFDVRAAANRRPSSDPRYRPAISSRASVTSPSTSSGTPRTSIPRNGGTASNTSRAQRGSRARRLSFTSPSAMTTSEASVGRQDGRRGRVDQRTKSFIPFGDHRTNLQGAQATFPHARARQGSVAGATSPPRYSRQARSPLLGSGSPPGEPRPRSLRRPEPPVRSSRYGQGPIDREPTRPRRSRGSCGARH
jgi:hypothetical protein